MPMKAPIGSGRSIKSPLSCLRLRPSTRFAPVANASFARYGSSKVNASQLELDKSLDYERRVSHLKKFALEEWYPPNTILPGEDVGHFPNAKLDEDTTDRSVSLQIRGRVMNVRTAGSKLVFLTISCGAEGDHQAMCNFKELAANGVTEEEFKQFKNTVRRGDWFKIVGHPQTYNGQPRVLVTKAPVLLAPSLHQVPLQLDDPETRARRPHTDMIVNGQLQETLRVRSRIEQTICRELWERDFTKVTTPLLAAGAGGAVARPFVTRATEMPDTELNLRIAPELWLKRLVVGGSGKIFEIGPAFRNEGIDGTHNPEFTICELYWPFVGLQYLMGFTESLMTSIHNDVRNVLKTKVQDTHVAMGDSHESQTTVEDDFFAAPYTQLEFIPTLEREMQLKLPDLGESDAAGKLLEIFGAKRKTPPEKPTLPRLLDALAGEYLEPLCEKPTFITHPPVALSPLAKSFTCPKTGQMVSARAELFIRGKEYANMYEEENSPFEQRKKFVDQLRYREVDGEGDGKTEIDESYIEALEWGLPPTGGWGLGIDRLVMLMSGQSRISDVLPFGTLRNVAALAKRPD